jgi:hypothetical protein
MNSELYELRIIKQLLSAQHADPSKIKEDALLDSAYWIKTDLEPKRNSRTETVSGGAKIVTTGCLRLQSLIQFKQCFVKGELVALPCSIFIFQDY